MTHQDQGQRGRQQLPREPSLRQHLEAAQQQVKRLEQQANKPPTHTQSQRQRQARCGGA